MPEGDSLFRLAARLRPLLVAEGHVVRTLELPRADTPTAHLRGRQVTKVWAQGKNLLVRFDEGTVLHVHLQMHGRVRVHRGPDARERAKRARSVAVVVLTMGGLGPGIGLGAEANEGAAPVPLDTIIVVERAPTARLLRERDLPSDWRLSTLGPDLLGETFDEDEALRRLRSAERADRPLGEVVMDQGAVAGIGNVYKSEVLFRQGLDPFAPVVAFTDEELRGVLRDARVLLQRNVGSRPFAGRKDPFYKPYDVGRVTRDRVEVGKGPVSVYGRRAHACFECGTAIEMARQGEQRRSTYWCPTCQPARSRALGAGMKA
jgi:endonuclease VIII